MAALDGMAIAEIGRRYAPATLQHNGVTISFASIRHALAQLEARNAAERVGDSRTWYRGGAA